MSNWPCKPIVIPAEDGKFDVYVGSGYYRMSREAVEKLGQDIADALNTFESNPSISQAREQPSPLEEHETNDD